MMQPTGHKPVRASLGDPSATTLAQLGILPKMRHSLPLAVVVALVSCCSPPPVSKPAPVDFNRLTDDFMYGALALSPVSATQAGYHEHSGMSLDEALDDYSAAAIEAQRRFYQSIQDRVSAIDIHSLDREQQADLKIIGDNIGLAILEIDTIQGYKHNPK